MLSSDKSAPVEPGAVRLSYELNATRLADTCWSCEGHSDKLGRLARKPRIWFYSAVGSVSLFAEQLSILEVQKELSHEWQVCVLSALGELDEPVYSMAPVVDLADPAGPPMHDAAATGQLAELRRDMDRIAESVRGKVLPAARRQMLALRKELKRV